MMIYCRQLGCVLYGISTRTAKRQAAGKISVFKIIEQRYIVACMERSNIFLFDCMATIYNVNKQLLLYFVCTNKHGIGPIGWQTPKIIQAEHAFCDIAAL